MPRYCYWSVADGPYSALMQNCLHSACGVFKEFHVLTDRALDGCESYDCYQFDKAHGLFKLHFLKAGMTRLNFDYFIWLDADTIFRRNPLDPLAVLGRSPIHVPLELNLADPGENQADHEAPLPALRDLYRQHGLANDPYLSGSAFWIIHHDAIEPVYDLAFEFWHKAKDQAKAGGLMLDISHALGYAMQILCAHPERHRAEDSPELWGEAAAPSPRLRAPAIQHLRGGLGAV